jgi:16S rRNA (cytidine1402-2'-O)-methyltransferase
VSGILYIVGTPIGNLEDITLRAIETLKNADLIACEDTRHSRVLLDRYEIKTRTTSYHKFSSKTKESGILDLLKNGKNVALISDAGMPGISDPGQMIVKAALDNDIKVEVIPGPCAAVAALAASGLNTDKFSFEGFLPAKQSDRIKRLISLSGEERTIILYEAPHRILETLEDLKQNLGDRNITIVRELTKKFEEIRRGKISDILSAEPKLTLKGEFVIIIEGGRHEESSVEGVRALMRDMIDAGLTKSNAVKMLSKNLNVGRNELYREALEL